MGAFKKNPESFLLLAAGAVLLLRQTGGVSSQAVAGEAASRVSEGAKNVRSTAAEVTDRARKSASEMAAQASDTVTQATRKVGEQSERVMKQAQSTLQDTVNRVLKDQPLMVMVSGLAAGAAVASVFPTTEIEKETLSPIGERVTEAATRVGEQLKEATATAGDTLKRAAEQRGLNSAGLKEVAGEVAGAFKDRISGDNKGPESEPQSGQRSSFPEA